MVTTHIYLGPRPVSGTVSGVYFISKCVRCGRTSYAKRGPSMLCLLCVMELAHA